MSELKKYISTYKGLGLQILPLKKLSKSPAIPGWQASQYRLEDFPEDCNVGIKITSKLADVDLDCREALELADVFLPPTFMQHGRPSRPRSHRWYNSLGEYQKYADERGCLLELRATLELVTHQTMIPPSTHEDGEQLVWYHLSGTSDEPGEPSTIAPEELAKACSTLAAATLLVRHFPPKGTRHELALALSGALLRNGWTVEATQHFIFNTYAAAGSTDPNTRAKTVQTTYSKIEAGEPVTGIPSIVEILGRDTTKKLTEWLGLESEDFGKAITNELELALHVAEHSPHLFFCPEDDKWYVWTGKHWRSESTDQQEILRRVTEVLDDLTKAAQQALAALPKPPPAPVPGPKKIKTKPTNAQRTLGFCQSASSWRSVLHVARLCELHMEVSRSKLDVSPTLLNCQNGTLDLETGLLAPHDKTQYLTKIANVAFDQSAVCPRWLGHLEHFLPDADVRGWVQVFLGYSMSALQKEQIFPIFTGTGNNGKSTLVETFAYLLGDYAKVAGDRAFAASHSETRPEIVRLEGARFVMASEHRDDVALDESLVKRMTGDREITARTLNKEPRTFAPTWKTVLLANGRPIIKGGDNGTWRRLRIVPFPVALVENEVILGYGDQLREEISGVLNWCLEGFRAWQQVGSLPTPDAVMQKTAELRQDSDPIDDFITTCLDIEDEGRERSVAVFFAYKALCRRRWMRDTDSLSMITFSGRMESHGFVKLKTRKNKKEGVMVWAGLRLNAEGKQLAAEGGYKEPIGGHLQLVGDE